MVLKHAAATAQNSVQVWFENDVKMYGTQAKSIDVIPAPTDAFENDVNMYGTQTGGESPVQATVA